MARIIRTYLSGCGWCNAKGYVNNPLASVTDTTITCPICQGAKMIMITETIEDDRVESIKVPEMKINSPQSNDK